MSLVWVSMHRSYAIPFPASRLTIPVLRVSNGDCFRTPDDGTMRPMRYVHLHICMRLLVARIANSDTAYSSTFAIDNPETTRLKIKMSAFLSGFTLTSIFGSSTNNDDEFWSEPSTLKTQLTAEASFTGPGIACDNSMANSLTRKHNVAHRRNQSLQLHYAAPSA